MFAGDGAVMAASPTRDEWKMDRVPLWHGHTPRMCAMEVKTTNLR
jgi:hypothetical protein